MPPPGPKSTTSSRSSHLVNLSNQDWKDVELWVNHKYVCFLPTFQPGPQKSVYFKMLIDDKGNWFPLNGAMIQNIELYHDGKMYNVPVHLAD